MADHGTVEERVARGAAFLDAVVPGWERCIDLTTLDLRFGAKCICGQVFRNAANVAGMEQGFEIARTLFTEGRSWSRELTDDDDCGSYADLVAADLGFFLTHDEILEYATVHHVAREGENQHDRLKPFYAKLQEAWTSLIKERFNSGSLSDS